MIGIKGRKKRFIEIIRGSHTLHLKFWLNVKSGMPCDRTVKLQDESHTEDGKMC